MGDYLSDLVTKNIGTAEIIQPRRAARFEPTQILTAFETQAESSLFSETSFEQENTIETTPRVRPRRRRQIKSSEKNAVISSPENPVEQTVEASFVAPVKTRTSEIKPILSRAPRKTHEIEARRETANQSFPQPASASAISTSITPKPTFLKFENAPEKPTNAIVPTPIQTRHAPQMRTDEFRISEQKNFDEKSSNTKNSETSDSKAKDFEAQIVEALAPVIAQPRVAMIENRFAETAIQPAITALPREQTSNQFSDRAEMSEAPTINVTIGRVEVRAVTASAPPKQTSGVKPQTMSLDEYLRKRGNGGER